MQAIPLEALELGLGRFLWPFLRVTFMFVAAPVLGSPQVPVRVRVALAFLVTLVVMPATPAAPASLILSGPGLLLAVEQALIGLAMGFLLQMVFAAVTLGGQTIALSMGLGFASVVDPQNGVQTAVISQFFLILATLLFLAMNGHLAMIAMVHDSFQLYPLEPGALTSADLGHLVAFGARMFAFGVLIALPAVTALLLTNIAFGVVTRSAPQLNIFGVGFPITLTLGFVVLGFALPTLLPQFEQLLDQAFGWM